jgi:hypothetical protein
MRDASHQRIHNFIAIQRMFDLNSLKDDKFRGEMGKLPVCQFLISKGPKKSTGIEGDLPIIFLKDTKLAGWIGGSQYGTPYTHTYKGGDSEQGIAFESFRCNIIAKSPRLIEVTQKGEDVKVGKRGQILGIFDRPGGYDLRNQYPKELTTLRTLYLMYFLDANGEFLHKVPYSLSVHGGAAYYFGSMLDQFYSYLESAYSDSKYGNGKFYTLSPEARSLGIFEPVLAKQKVGEGSNVAEVASVGSFVEPNGESIDAFFNSKNADRIFATQESMSGFADKYLKQFAEYHPNPAGLVLSEVDQETGEIYPPIKPALTFANAKSYKPQEQADYDYNTNDELDYPPY